MIKVKKTLGILVAICFLCVSMTMPVFAASMSSFPMQTTSSYSANYTRAVQVMMLCYNKDTRSYVESGGGADGVYGAKTASAVKVFQKAKGLSQDGKCGSNTWKALQGTLVQNSYDSVQVNYKFPLSYKGCVEIMRQIKNTGSWYCYTTKWNYVG